MFDLSIKVYWMHARLCCSKFACWNLWSLKWSDTKMWFFYVSRSETANFQTLFAVMITRKHQLFELFWRKWRFEQFQEVIFKSSCNSDTECPTWDGGIMKTNFRHSLRWCWRRNSTWNFKVIRTLRDFWFEKNLSNKIHKIFRIHFKNNFSIVKIQKRM